MPRERREIIFSNKEFREATSVYLRRKAGHNIAGELVDIVLKPGNSLSAFAEFNDETNNVTVKVRLGMADLGALLTLFCITNNIPLPRKAHRSVHAVGGNIALMINIEGPKEDDEVLTSPVTAATES